MNTVYLKNEPCHTYGTVPAVGQKAHCYNLVASDLKEISCQDFVGKKVVLNIFPSLDTPVCAASVRRFNKEAAAHKDVVVICVSMDLPFAMSRFCTAEGIDGVTPASAFRSPDFGKVYGLTMTDGPLAGLLARAVIIVDADRNVIYSDLVNEITDEPDYDGAFYVLTND